MDKDHAIYCVAFVSFAVVTSFDLTTKFNCAKMCSTTTRQENTGDRLCYSVHGTSGLSDAFKKLYQSIEPN